MRKGLAKAPALRTFRFAIQPQRLVIFELGRSEGFALLEWLGLGRPEFGAIEARMLVPRCRRRLWREFEKEEHGRLRALVCRLLVSLEMFPNAIVTFG